MVQNKWKGLVLVALGAGMLMFCSVGAGSDEACVHITKIERGSIDVGGTAISFLGNLGSSPPAATAATPGAERNVLLLHGAKYSAQTWEDLGTLALLANKGYRVAAVDLPTRPVPSGSKDKLLELLCRGLGMAEDSPAVIVSPSMSGTFSVPLLFRKPDLFAGYVPVAPGQALSYTADAFAGVTGVPALIVYGELDGMGARASSLLRAIPDSRVLMIAGASHPAYLDEPRLFHKELLGFLEEEAVFPHEGRILCADVR